MKEEIWRIHFLFMPLILKTEYPARFDNLTHPPRAPSPLLILERNQQFRSSSTKRHRKKRALKCSLILPYNSL